jgi:hypothetical protein
VPELSKCSGRNLLFLGHKGPVNKGLGASGPRGPEPKFNLHLLFLKKTQVLWFILHNTIRFLYFLFVHQWACHLKCFCCSVHHSSHSNVDVILFFLQNNGNISSKTHILQMKCECTRSKDNIFHTMTNCPVWSTGIDWAPVSCSSTDVKRKLPAALP